MTIRQVLKKYSSIEIELLLASVLGKPKEFLFMNPDFMLTPKHLKILTRYIRRRQKGEPVAYILGYKDFCGLRFKVNKNVLVPRPETEGLVERVLNFPACSRLKLQLMAGRKFPFLKKPIRILDVGTGSGCIIISLAKVLEGEFYASDISKKALSVAKENAKNHKVKIKFIQSDLLSNIKGKFNIIVANLPYVPISDYKQLKNGLKYEPSRAIFAKNRGLMLIEKLLKQISQLKEQPKAAFLEFDPRQKVSLSKLIKKYLPDSNIKFYQDLSKRWRYVVIFTK